MKIIVSGLCVLEVHTLSLRCLPLNLLIVVDGFCVALFSTLEHTHWALVACVSEWVTVAFKSEFWISTEVVYLQHCLIVTWLVPRETAAVSIQWCTVSRHFMLSHIRRVHACLAVTCNLHFWQNGRDLLRATAVTRGWNDTEIRISTESRPWRRKFSRRSRRDLNPGPFSYESGALTTELSSYPHSQSGSVVASLPCLHLSTADSNCHTALIVSYLRVIADPG